MASSTSTIDDLRRRIDEIDDQLHDLIMQRAEVVETLGAGKKRGRVGTIRPGREAQILRRLTARHRGRFPRSILVRLWRELISGAVALQGDFAVAVSVDGEMPDFWDLARDHFGSHTPMAAFHSVGEVLRALAEGRAGAGVLPMPAEGEREPWWPLLAISGAAAPRIMVRLPFAGRGNARGDGGLDALVIGYGDPDPTEEDRSFVAFELAGELSRARLIGALKGAGLAVTLFAAHEPASSNLWHLVEIDAGLAADDARLARALGPFGDQIARVAHLGTYPKPIPPGLLGRGGGRQS